MLSESPQIVGFVEAVMKPVDYTVHYKDDKPEAVDNIAIDKLVATTEKITGVSRTNFVVKVSELEKALGLVNELSQTYPFH